MMLRVFCVIDADTLAPIMPRRHAHMMVAASDTPRLR